MVVAQKTNTARPRKPYTYPEETAAQLRTEQLRTTTAAEKVLYQMG